MSRSRGVFSASRRSCHFLVDTESNLGQSLHKHLPQTTFPFAKNAAAEESSNYVRLDERRVREALSDLTLENWKRLLESLDGKGTSEAKFFLDCSLLACVELGLRGHLMAALEWLGPGGGGGQEEGGGCPWVERENHECLLRACHGGDGEAAAALRAKGFSVRSLLGSAHIPENSRLDVVLELTRLEAAASPAYLAASAASGEDEVDPAGAALALLEAVAEQEPNFQAFHARFASVRRSLVDVLVGLLDRCSDQAEVELFLGRVDVGVCGMERGGGGGGGGLLPRIDLALQLGLTQLVTHDSVQMCVRRTFYAEGYEEMKFRRGTSKLLHTCGKVLLLPLLAFLHVVRRRILCCCGGDGSGGERKGSLDMEEEGKNGESVRLKKMGKEKEEEEGRCRQSGTRWWSFAGRYDGGLFDVPANRLFCDLACYFVLVVLAAFTASPVEPNGKIDLNWCAVVTFLWVSGHAVADLEALWSGAAAEAKRRGTYADLRVMGRLFWSGGGGWLRSFRLCSHLVFLLGMAAEGAGYLAEERWGLRAPADRGCDVDDTASFRGYHPVTVGVCLQGVGLIMIILYGLHFFRLHSALGSFYIALGECLRVLLSFFATFAVVSAAFALGMHSVLRHSAGDCDAGGGLVASRCGGGGGGSPAQFRAARVEVGLACVAEGVQRSLVFPGGGGKPASNRTVCSPDCWSAFARDPSDEASWLGACREGGIQTRPKIDVDLKAYKPERQFSSVKRNRFHSLRSSFKTVYWSLFSAGHPNKVDCTSGAARHFSLALWALYGLVSGVVLMNLLIALLSATIGRASGIDAWKYHRTRLWMEHCGGGGRRGGGRGSALPPPFNLLDLLVKVLVCKSCCCCSGGRSDLAEVGSEDPRSKSEDERYRELMSRLVAAYAAGQRLESDHGY